MAHDPTKDRAPAHSFAGSNAPSAATCSPGARYFLQSSITKTGKQVAPSALVTARPKSKSLVTPGPSDVVNKDYTTDPAHKHVFHTAPANSLASRAKGFRGFRTPAPGTYSLPRILGLNTAYTPAEPCYSMKGKSQYPSCFQEVAKTPGPAALDKVDLDVYKTRAPKFSMGLKTNLPGKGAFPAPAQYTLGKLAVTKAWDPAFSFGLQHSLFKASLIAETHLD
ncbi:ciliary microtubule associated protein 1A-like [Agelaius phoeniceus]|uniref:ciliary microtubule associated protein 1A-like n=1 Tax=Agelaius phoeniceus TaxID=39638 RepID=UPI0040553206